MITGWNYSLPFGISRWWDVLIGPIVILLGRQLGKNKKLEETLKTEPELLFGIAVILAFGLLIGVIGPIFGVIPTVIGMLVYGLMCRPSLGSVWSLIAGAGVALGMGLPLGLLGLLIGLTAIAATYLILKIGRGLAIIVNLFLIIIDSFTDSSNRIRD